jgi:hypothetical protein
MKRINFVSLFAAAAFGGLVFQASDTPASASGLNDVLNSSGASLNGHVKIEPAGHRRARRHRARRHHGRRFRHRRSGYRHYRGGYWYASPWWLLGAAAGAAIYAAPRNSGGGHVRWCLNRYRSYNPDTDRFLAYSGRYKRCRSPYRP